MTFLWPHYLWLLLALPLLPLLYLWLLRRRGKPALRYSSLGAVRAAAGSATWRRHVPPALLLIACAVLLLATARPLAVVTLPWTRSQSCWRWTCRSACASPTSSRRGWWRRRRRPSSSCATCPRTSRSASSLSPAAPR